MTAKLPHVPPADPASMLSADRRLRDIDRASGRPVDVLVIGGGITGVGVALDAATRGLSVALVEREDLAYGTSRWSSKLVHGGLRYLAKLQVGVAWESAVERERIMASIAPHLVRPMPQVLPDIEGVHPRLVHAGLRAADSLRRATGSTLQGPSRLDADELQAYVPGVHPDADGGWLSWDGQLLDDARLVVAVARTAAAYGARILTHTRVVAAAEGAASAAGTVQLADTLTDERWTLQARHVVNATGAWAEGLDPRVTLVRSRGTHLVVATDSIGGGDAALMAPVAGSTSRFVFALPQPEGLTFIGLTDVATDEPLDSPQSSEDEVTFLLDTFNRALATPLTRADVITTYSGYRPLLAGEAGSSADLSRRHAVLPEDADEGLPLSIVGGKLTTYRRMAEDAVDLLTDRPCRTRRLPLVGAQPWDAQADRLTRRFGAEAARVAALAHGRPSAMVPIAGTPVLPVELTWAMAAEGAVTDSDVLERRLRLDLAPQWRDAVAAELAARWESAAA
ncbi:MAG: glycerol-3-phosphate dehydrogenase/oxidase [Candidatus Nanopelagicales bacterium]